MEHTFPLRLLPVEVQCFIIQSLDPIGLISLSQTGRFYRQLINPSRTEQIERLLALECLPKYGGDRPAILHPDSDEAVGGPDWHRDAWPEYHRWACALCLRLLPHHHFDNHSLLRQRYRKPGPGSPEVTPVTSWRPGPGSRAGRRAGKGARRNACRQRRQQLGWGRARRKCNECMFQRGEFGNPTQTPNGYMHGTPDVPIQVGRRLVFNSAFDRYFPGLEASLETGPRPFPLRRDTLVRANIREETWTMYMVRCPGCQRWQEQRAFRFGDYTKHWRPRVDWAGRLMQWSDPPHENCSVKLDEVRCNRCFVREHGRDALGRKLLNFFRTVIDRLFLEAEFLLGWNWALLPASLPTTRRAIPKQYFEVFQEMRKRATYGVEGDCYEKRQGIECMTYAHVANSKMVHEEFKTLWTVMKTHADFIEEGFLGNAHFTAWFNCYQESEAIWFWLREVRCEVERNPDMLVAWALGRDGAWLT